MAVAEKSATLHLSADARRGDQGATLHLETDARLAMPAIDWRKPDYGPVITWRGKLLTALAEMDLDEVTALT